MKRAAIVRRLRNQISRARALLRVFENPYFEEILDSDDYDVKMQIAHYVDGADAHGLRCWLNGQVPLRGLNMKQLLALAREVGMRGAGNYSKELLIIKLREWKHDGSAQASSRVN